MKIVIGLSFVFAFSSFIGVNGDVMDTVMDQTIEECLKIENATDEDADALFNDHEWSETREGKCFIDCFLEGIGIFKDQKFSKKGFLSFTLMAFDGHGVAKNSLNNFIRKINKDCGGVNFQDRCDNAFEFAKCFVVHLSEFEDGSFFYDDSPIESNEKGFRIEASEMKIFKAMHYLDAVSLSSVMKLIAITTLICMFALQAIARNKDLEQKLMLVLLNECKVAEGGTDEDVNNLMKVIIPESKEGRCILACCYSKVGIYESGKFSRDTFIHMAKMMVDDDQNKLEIAAQIADKCGPTSEGERCDQAVKFTLCLHEAVNLFHIDIDIV